MTQNLSPMETAKFVAAKRASGFVEDGMRVGLGTGSTAAWLVRCLGELVQQGLHFTAVPTSARTASMAREVGITLSTLEDVRWLDLTIDGADEFDKNLNLLKGGGGAHLQEKIVATSSDRMIVIADASKAVNTLGAFPLPLEIVPFGWRATKMQVEEALIGMDVLGRQTTLRMNGEDPYVTDEGNYLLDLHLQRIGNPNRLSLTMNQIAGVIENGLFTDICDTVIIGHSNGKVEIRDMNSGTQGEDRFDFLDDNNIFTSFDD